MVIRGCARGGALVWCQEGVVYVFILYWNQSTYENPLLLLQFGVKFWSLLGDSRD